MSSTAFAFSQPLLRRLNPERAHDLTLAALERSQRHGLIVKSDRRDDPRLATKLFGVDVANPIGVAAGFDKDARVPDAMLSLGFGFTEVGTLTPKPQDGNPKPRIFRLAKDGAVINRLGFNNGGHDAGYARLRARTGQGLVGVNLGANKDTQDKAADYVAGVERFAEVAGYFMVNVSSPNTPGLRDLQAPDQVADLLGRVIDARDAAAANGGRRVPIAIKLAPDIAEDDLAPVVERIAASGVDAVAVSNTTLARPSDLASRTALISEQGGLSGGPLFDRATIMLARVYRLTGGCIPLIGIGGIDSGERAVEKMRAGATAIQLYTGLVFQGPPLLLSIKSALVRATIAADAAHVRSLTGTAADAWAERSLAP
ncbi:MAG: quinone-dependent dihydroorotate dehydrogenase [Pseudomonadota bacterium]